MNVHECSPADAGSACWTDLVCSQKTTLSPRKDGDVKRKTEGVEKGKFDSASGQFFSRGEASQVQVRLGTCGERTDSALGLDAPCPGEVSSSAPS